MSFLRFVIADARPRKPKLESAKSPSSINGWKTRGLDGNGPATDEKPLGVVDQARHSSESLSIRDRASEINLDNTLTESPTDNPVNRDGLGMESNLESEIKLSVPVDIVKPILDEESVSHMNFGNHGDRGLSSEGDQSCKATESLTPRPAGVVIQDGYLTSQGNDFLIEFQDRHALQNQSNGNDEIEPASSPLSITETHTIQTRSTQTTNLNSSQSSQRIEPGVLGPSLVPAIPTPGASGNPRPDAVAVTRPQKIGADRDLQQPGESLVGDAFGPLNGRTTTPSNPAWRKEAEKALTEAGKADNDSPGDDKQADMKGLPRDGNVPRFQKPNEVKETTQDVQLVSQHTTAIVPQATKDIEHVPNPQSAGNKKPVSANSPPNFAQPVARPVTNLASHEALRSVPAKPFKTNPIPHVGESFRSRPAHKPHEKKHEGPKVQIGQLDVIIETATQSATKPASTPATTDLASRHYLRRL